MQKIRIRLPATLTNLGPGLNSLGLAIGLYTTVEISRRTDDELDLTFTGEGAGSYPSELHHPVILGMSRFFQRLERAPLGISVRVDNAIPLASGLGAEAAFMVAGVLGANDIMGFPYNRDTAYGVAAKISRADHAVTALNGGLTASLFDGDTLHYRALPVASMQVAICMPLLERYPRPALPESIPAADVASALSRQPLFITALRDGDYDLLAAAVQEPINLPRLAANLSGFEHVRSQALQAGAKAVTISGSGPSVVAFAEKDHARIAETMRVAFGSSGVEARTWVLPVDTQGVVISAMQSA